MDWSNLIVQLGISALVLFVVFRMGMKLIENNAKSESERTQAIREGFQTDTAAHTQLASAMQDMANAVAEGMTELEKQFSRVEGKMDAFLDLTPVRGIRAASVHNTDDETTPVDRPAERPTPNPAKQQKQPRAGSLGGVGGIYGPKKPG